MTKFFDGHTNLFLDDEINSIPAWAVEISDSEWIDLLQQQSKGKLISSDENGKPILIDPPAPDREQTIAQYEAAAQENLDSVAKQWGYSSIVAAVSYVNSTNDQYKADALALIAWRDAYWTKAYEIESGTLPKTAAEFVALLPKAPVKPT